MNPDEQTQWIEEVNEDIAYYDESEDAATIFEIIAKKHAKIYEGAESSGGGWSDNEGDPILDRVDSEDKVNRLMATLQLRDTYCL